MFTGAGNELVSVRLLHLQGVRDLSVGVIERLVQNVRGKWESVSQEARGWQDPMLHCAPRLTRDHYWYPLVREAKGQGRFPAAIGRSEQN